MDDVGRRGEVAPVDGEGDSRRKREVVLPGGASAPVGYEGRFQRLSRTSLERVDRLLGHGDWMYWEAREVRSSFLRALTVAKRAYVAATGLDPLALAEEFAAVSAELGRATDRGDTQADEEIGRGEVVRQPWNTAFTRSTLQITSFYVRGSRTPAPAGLANVHAACVGLTAAGFPSSVFTDSAPGYNVESVYTQIAFLDGGVVGRQGNHFYGLKGTWVLGFTALRFLCDVLELRPPRRLKGEERTVTLSQTLSELSQQAPARSDELRQRLKEYELIR